MIFSEWFVVRLCICGYSSRGTSNHFVDINEMVVNIKSMGNIKEIKRTLTLLRKITKYGIFLLSFLCTIYCGMIYLGLNLVGIHWLLFSFALVLRLMLSKIFGLCWVHRVCIGYIFAVSLCVSLLNHEKVSVLGLDAQSIHGINFVTGLLLIPLILWKAKNKSCQDNIYNED